MTAQHSRTLRLNRCWQSLASPARAVLRVVPVFVCLHDALIAWLRVASAMADKTGPPKHTWAASEVIICAC